MQSYIFSLVILVCELSLLQRGSVSIKKIPVDDEDDGNDADDD